MRRHRVGSVAALVIAAVIVTAWLVVASLPRDAETAAVRGAAEGAVRTLYANPQPPAGYNGAGLSPSQEQALRQTVGADLRRYFTPDLVARYEPLLSGAIDGIGSGTWDSDTTISIDWGSTRIDAQQAEVSFAEHRGLIRHTRAASPPAWRLDAVSDWTVTLAKDADGWKVAAFDFVCRSGCP